MKKAIVSQVVILVMAWVLMTPDILEDNTLLFGLFGSYDLVRGNAHWVMLGAAVLSALNIWFWWPKAQVTSTLSGSAESTKGAEASAEAKAEETKAEDPVVPKMD